MAAPKYIRLDFRDNVATATQSLEVGEIVDGVATTALIPRGHKVALENVPQGGLKHKTHLWGIGGKTAKLAPAIPSPF